MKLSEPLQFLKDLSFADEVATTLRLNKLVFKKRVLHFAGGVFMLLNGRSREEYWPQP
jgi:hypothetical protein